MKGYKSIRNGDGTIYIGETKVIFFHFKLQRDKKYGYGETWDLKHGVRISEGFWANGKRDGLFKMYHLYMTNHSVLEHQA